MNNSSILIVGYRSKISKEIKKNLEKKYKISILSLRKFKKITSKKLRNFNIIVNCSFNKNCFNNRCNSDVIICDKLKNNPTNIKFVMLSTSKVYGDTKKKMEISKCKPLTKYGKYRLYSEEYLKKRLKKNLIILRVSNVLNFDTRTKSISKTVINTMLTNLIKKNKIFIPIKNCYKDFITSKYLITCLDILLKKNCYGIYNISSNIKISLNQLAKKLIKSFGKGKIYFIEETTDSFTISNDLIKKTTGIKLKKDEILTEVEKIGKKLKGQKSW